MGISLPFALPAVRRASDNCFAPLQAHHATPRLPTVAALSKPPLLTGLQLLPVGLSVITVSHYRVSLDAFAAPLALLLLSTPR